MYDVLMRRLCASHNAHKLNPRINNHSYGTEVRARVMASKARVLSLESIQVAGCQLHLRFAFDSYHFSTSYWYDFDLQSLGSVYGAAFMEKVYFHCAAFEIIKFCSLVPAQLDWGRYAHLHTEKFEKTWTAIVRGVSSQWRYENNLKKWTAPRFASSPVLDATGPVELQPNSEGIEVLASFGGGKDSVVLTELLRKAGISFSTVSYSSSIYGRSAFQHELNDTVLKLCSSKVHHKLFFLEDFLESPVLESLGKQLGIKSLFAAHTPASLFAAVPILLHFRYTAIVFGHEYSANEGNLVWEATGEQVNHQWEKSLEAEVLMSQYLQEVLISNAHYFSPLQPIANTLIFQVANTIPDAIVLTHSCNLVFPWCMTCQKCCYVWLSFMAYMPVHLIDGMFQSKNLFDIAQNEVHFREMMGLGQKKPFECVGEIDEARLAFEICRQKGLLGRAMVIYNDEIASSLSAAHFVELVEKYTTVHKEHNIPEKYRDRLFLLLDKIADKAQSELMKNVNGVAIAQ